MITRVNVLLTRWSTIKKKSLIAASAIKYATQWMNMLLTWVQPSIEKIDDYKFHMEQHFAEKQFNCTKCNKVFKIMNERVTHMEQHFKEVFHCNKCNQVFETKDEFCIHMENHNKQTGAMVSGNNIFITNLTQKSWCSWGFIAMSATNHWNVLLNILMEICVRFAQLHCLIVISTC